MESIALKTASKLNSTGAWPPSLSSKKLSCCEQTCALLREIVLLSTGKSKIKFSVHHDASTANTAQRRRQFQDD